MEADEQCSVSEEVLGRGGFALVYLGSFQGGRVAVKKVQIARMSDEREENAMLKLKHPNVIRLLHKKKSGEFKLFFLELCQGTLKTYCKERTNWPSIEEIDGLLQMADGLRYIHEKKLVHRDIKPENILFVIEASDGSVTFKISDFGLVKETTEHGTFSVSDLKGTVYYMAPEFWENYKECSTDSTNDFRGSQAADVFAMGCVFFFYLTDGSHPFGGMYAAGGNIIEGKFDISTLGNHFASALIEEMIARDDSSRPTMKSIFERLQMGRESAAASTEGGVRGGQVHENVVHEDMGWTQILEDCTLLVKGQPSVYRPEAVEKVEVIGTGSVVKYFVIGQPNYAERKTILLLGASSSGKSTLVDGMINYVLGVRRNDPFRFKIALVEDNQNSKKCITTFTLHHRANFTIPYSLTIIDAPDFGNMEDEDSEIMEQLRKSLSQQGNQVNAICLVANSNDTSLTSAQMDFITLAKSLLGAKSTVHFRLLTTFADGASEPSVVQCFTVKVGARPHFYKFNNSVIFASGENESPLDQTFWDMNWNSYKSFFSALSALPEVSLQIAPKPSSPDSTFLRPSPTITSEPFPSSGAANRPENNNQTCCLCVLCSSCRRRQSENQRCFCSVM